MNRIGRRGRAARLVVVVAAARRRPWLATLLALLAWWAVPHRPHPQPYPYLGRFTPDSSYSDISLCPRHGLLLALRTPVYTKKTGVVVTVFDADTARVVAEIGGTGPLSVPFDIGNFDPGWVRCEDNRGRFLLIGSSYTNDVHGHGRTLIFDISTIRLIKSIEGHRDVRLEAFDSVHNRAFGLVGDSDFDSENMAIGTGTGVNIVDPATDKPFSPPFLKPSRHVGDWDEHHVLSPLGVLVDERGGRLYVPDYGHSRVLVFDLATLAHVGTLGIAGKFGDGNNQFDGPTGIAVDHAAGLILVADFGNNRVQIFDEKTMAYVDTLAHHSIRFPDRVFVYKGKLIIFDFPHIEHFGPYRLTRQPPPTPTPTPTVTHG